MSIWGRLLGGAAGFALGGPIGAGIKDDGLKETLGMPLYHNLRPMHPVDDVTVVVGAAHAGGECDNATGQQILADFGLRGVPVSAHGHPKRLDPVHVQGRR